VLAPRCKHILPSFGNGPGSSDEPPLPILYRLECVREHRILERKDRRGARSRSQFDIILSVYLLALRRPNVSGAGSEEEIMDRALQQAKLAKLFEIEGFDSIDQLLEAVVSDSASPAICMNEGCDFTCDMESDQTRGWCEECGTNSMVAAAILAGLI
jgi:hypothetical protein